MEESTYQIAEKISKLYQEENGVYLPLVEDVCSRTVPEDELSHLLDYLLDFACDEKCWDCTKGYVESIWMYIPVVLGIILKRIGRCRKTKENWKMIYGLGRGCMF